MLKDNLFERFMIFYKNVWILSWFCSKTFNQANQFLLHWCVFQFLFCFFLPITRINGIAMNWILDDHNFQYEDIVFENIIHVLFYRRVKLIDFFQLFIFFYGSIEKQQYRLVIFSFFVDFTQKQVDLRPFVKIFDISKYKICFNRNYTVNKGLYGLKWEWGLLDIGKNFHYIGNGIVYNVIVFCFLLSTLSRSLWKNLSVLINYIKDSLIPKKKLPLSVSYLYSFSSDWMMVLNSKLARFEISISIYSS